MTRVGEPGGGFVHAPVETVQAAVRRLPAEQVAGLGVVGPEALDLALLRAQALVVGEDVDIDAHNLDDGAGGVADADREVAAEVDHLAGALIAVQGRLEASHGVGDVVEVARGVQGAKLDAALAVGNLGNDGRDDGPGRLARTVGVEGPQDGDRGAEGQVERQGDLVRADLARRIGGLALKGMVLGDGDEAGGAIDLAGGGVDDPADAQFAGGLHHVERALDVGVHIGVGRVVRVGNGDECRQVQDGVTTGHGGAHPVGIADVAGEYFEMSAHFLGAVVEPALGIIKSCRARRL